MSQSLEVFKLEVWLGWCAGLFPGLERVAEGVEIASFAM